MGGLGLGARRAVQSVVKRAIAQGPASGSWRHSNAISDIANRARLRRRRHQEQGAHSMGGAIPLGAGDWVVARWQPDDPYPRSSYPAPAMIFRCNTTTAIAKPLTPASVANPSGLTSQAANASASATCRAGSPHPQRAPARTLRVQTRKASTMLLAGRTSGGKACASSASAISKSSISTSS